MSLEVEATYENGVLKPDKPLPLGEHERVTIRVQTQTSHIRESAGLVRLPDQPEAIEYLLGRRKETSASSESVKSTDQK